METLHDDKDIIEAVTTKYREHFQQAKFHVAQSEKFKRMLEAYKGVDISNNSETESFSKFESLLKDFKIPTSGSKVKRKKSENRQTFESVILDIFADGKPRLVSELIKEYKEKTGLELDSKDFSSKMSIRSKKGRIKNAKFINFPIDKRYWWGLSEFFDGTALKPSFEAIVHEKYKNMI